MSMPNIPNVSPDIDIERKDVINLILASVAFEELGIAHLINAEAEKIQFVLGTLHEHPKGCKPCTKQVIKINETVNHAMRNVIKSEMLLQMKVEDVLSLLDKCTDTDGGHGDDDDHGDDDNGDDHGGDDDCDCDCRIKWWQCWRWWKWWKCRWKKKHGGGSGDCGDCDKKEKTQEEKGDFTDKNSG